MLKVAVGQIDRGEDPAGRPARILDADAPRSAAVADPTTIQVAAGLDHEVAEAAAAKDADAAIDRVAFADAAEVDAHPLLLQERRARRASSTTSER